MFVKQTTEKVMFWGFFAGAVCIVAIHFLARNTKVHNDFLAVAPWWTIFIALLIAAEVVLTQNTEIIAFLTTVLIYGIGAILSKHEIYGKVEEVVRPCTSSKLFRYGEGFYAVKDTNQETTVEQEDDGIVQLNGLPPGVEVGEMLQTRQATESIRDHFGEFQDVDGSSSGNLSSVEVSCDSARGSEDKGERVVACI